MYTLGYRQGSGEAIPAIIHPSYVAGGQTWTVLSGVKKDVLNTVRHASRVTLNLFLLKPRGKSGTTHSERIFSSKFSFKSLNLRFTGLATYFTGLFEGFTDSFTSTNHDVASGGSLLRTPRTFLTLVSAVLSSQSPTQPSYSKEMRMTY